MNELQQIRDALGVWEDFAKRDLLNKAITVQELFGFMRKYGEVVSIALIREIDREKHER